MVPIRCTNKLIKALNQKPSTIESPQSNRLGAWYANIIPTPAGDTVLFASETSYLSVLVPTSEMAQLFPLFAKRVENLLGRLDLPIQIVNQEMANYSELVIAKTADRKVVASMNRIADDLWYMMDAKLKRGAGPLSLSAAEDDINSTLRGPEPYFRPVERARETLLAPPMSD